MKATEIQTLLDRIAGYDGRAFAPAAGPAWLQVLMPYPLADCERAVDEHYSINTDRVMPADIRSRCIVLRDLRAAAEQRALPPAPRPKLGPQGLAARAEVRRLVAQVAGRMDAAMREPMRADASAPTTAEGDITAGREAQLARLAHEAA